MAHGGADAEAKAAAEAEAEAEGFRIYLELLRETEDTSPCWVFWDVESCPCPLSKLDVADMFPKIKSILGQWGFRGPVEMIAVGSEEMFPHQAATELTNSGVIIRSFEYEECSNLAGRVVGIIALCIARKDPPANILLISDRHFVVHYNRMCEHGYNVLLRHQPRKGLVRFVCTWNPRDCDTLQQLYQHDALLQQHESIGVPRERQNYCWSWEEVLEGRPWSRSKRFRDVGESSLSEAKRLAL